MGQRRHPRQLKSMTLAALKGAYHETEESGHIEEHRAIADEFKRRDPNDRRATPIIKPENKDIQ